MLLDGGQLLAIKYYHALYTVLFTNEQLMSLQIIKITVLLNSGSN